MTRAAKSRMNPSRFTTTDLCLATFLIMEGCEAVMYKSGERQNGYPIGGWEFDNGDAIKQSVLEFKAGSSRVEPKAFHDRLNKCREEMFDFLGIGKRTKK